MKKWTVLMIGISLLTITLVLSGCFQTQTTLSYDSYIQATPFSSITHIFIFLKSITANYTYINSGITQNSSSISAYNQLYDLVPPVNSGYYVYKPISQEGITLSGNPPFSINSLSINIGPDATIVLGNGLQYTVPVSQNITVPFYTYNLGFYKSPLQMVLGSNKTALILWNLSNLSTSTNSTISLSASGLDMTNLTTLNILYAASNVTTTDPYLYTDGVYPEYRYAELSAFGNNAYTFTAQGYWNTLTKAYGFTFYPFASQVPSVQQSYQANYYINSATETFFPSATETTLSNFITITGSNQTVIPKN